MTLSKAVPAALGQDVDNLYLEFAGFPNKPVALLHHALKPLVF